MFCLSVHYLQAKFMEARKKELNPMELGLQMVVSHHICTETEAGSCVRITNALNF